MAKTAHAVATDMSRDFKLGLSNGEWIKLVDHVELHGEQEVRRLYAAGPEAVREVVRPKAA